MSEKRETAHSAAVVEQGSSVEYRHRVYKRDDGGFSFEVLVGDDDRPLARINIHEIEGTKLFRKFSVTTHARVDDRVRHEHWSMRFAVAVARVLRGDDS